MGKVLVTAKLENLEDLYMVHKGLMPVDQARAIEVADALVDTGCTGLAIPRRLIAHLGLRPLRTRMARTMNGMVTLQTYEAVRLTIQGRECTVDTFEIADDLPVTVGQIPLEALDWVVDLQGRKLIGNPDHGGEHMLDALACMGRD